MTASDRTTAEINMNTVAVLAWLEEPERRTRCSGVMALWSRGEFAVWLMHYCLDEIPMTVEAALVVDWEHVADALFLASLQEQDVLGALEPAADA